jgi:hypothetical protein
MMSEELIKIKQFNLISEDERGITAEFSLPRKQDNFVFITRKAASISGNTYHEGKTAATSPKLFLLLQGEIYFSYRKVGEKEKYRTRIIAPAVIEVAPYVTHNVEGVSDFILLEGNSLKDVLGDRIREEV